MNIVRKVQPVFGLATVLTLAALAAPSVQAQGFMHHHQMHRAARLDRQAAHAAFNGNYRRAARLRQRANHLRFAARHGF